MGRPPDEVIMAALGGRPYFAHRKAQQPFSMGPSRTFLGDWGILFTNLQTKKAPQPIGRLSLVRPPAPFRCCPPLCPYWT